jgi:Ras-related C3 botulinum toxin substrate 1
VHHATDRV